MSAVQNDASDQLKTAVAAAQANGGFPGNISSVDYLVCTHDVYIAKSEAAPPGNPSIATTISGVPQAATTNSVSSSNSGNNHHSSAGRPTVVLSWTLMCCLLATLCVWSM
jgi:hypothetical protein